MRVPCPAWAPNKNSRPGGLRRGRDGIAHGRRDTQAVVGLAELPPFSEGAVGLLGEDGEAAEQGGQVPADRIIGPRHCALAVPGQQFDVAQRHGGNTLTLA